MSARVHQEILRINTDEPGFTDLTQAVGQVVHRSGIKTGTCALFVQHTSCSLVIQENADPAVLRDLQKWMAGLAAPGRRWEHKDEGPDDMPAHARSAITSTSEVIPIGEGAMLLGTWQGIYLWEHRTRGNRRNVIVTVSGAGW